MSKAGGGERRNHVRSLANEPCPDVLALGDVAFGLASSACDLGRFVVPPLPQRGTASCVIKAKCTARTRFGDHGSALRESADTPDLRTNWRAGPRSRKPLHRPPAL